MGKDRCESWSQMQAWAQNLGHESLTTTFGSYGKVSASEQGQLVRKADTNKDATENKLDTIIQMIKKSRA
jgi:integrase/recombinase XerD